MNFQKLLIALSAIILIAAFAFIQGCSNDESPVQSLAESQVDNIDPNQTENGGEVEPPVVERIGAQMNVGWPFGPYELMSDWNGWESWRSRTGGMSGSYCGGTRPSTHSGAEYYARDLNHNRGLDYNIMLFAGIAGRVVYAGWQNGYGNTVVIYDQNRHVALRYAHMRYIYNGIYVGRNIPAKAYLGTTGNTGLSSGSHLHIVGYENINDNNGNPIIPNLCDSDYFACRIDFYWWNF